MNTQSHQSASADAGQTPINQSDRAPFGGYAQAPPVPGRDVKASGLPNLFGNLNLQSQGPGPKYNNSIKGNMGMPPNFDMSAARPPYNGQFFLFPNAPIYGSLPQVSPFGPAPVPGQDQAHMPLFPPNMYPNASPMAPGPMQPYPWPYVMNYDMQDLKRNTWGSTDEQKGQAPSPMDTGSQPDYYGSVPSNMDNTSSISGYPFGVAPNLGQPCLPLQMMKTATGYIMQDMEVLTQQDPPIPRAVPAMWTNPSEMTLAKCLENREGITNVYIRGFLPETTDEMLFSYASRFGKIDRCKAIVDLDTGLCKGYVCLYSKNLLTMQIWLCAIFQL